MEAWGVVFLVRAARARRRMERRRGGAPAGGDHREDSEPRRGSEEHDLPPIPDEVQRVLDRIMADGRAQHESEKKK